MGWLLQVVPSRLVQVGTNQQTVVPLGERLVFPRGCSRRKPELSYHQHSPSAGPYRQLSSRQWALSELLSIERADIDWKYESALARSHHLQPLRDTRYNVENRIWLSPERLPRCLANFRMVLSTGQLPQPLLLPLRSAQGRTTQQPGGPSATDAPPTLLT